MIDPDSDDANTRLYWASLWAWKRLSPKTKQQVLADLAKIHEAGITEEEIREAIAE